MVKKILSFLFVAVVLSMLVVPVAAESNIGDNLQYHNTVSANSSASVSNSGLLTVSNRYQGLPGTTTRGEIKTYIEKKILGLFWIRVNIDQPNNEWHDVVYDYLYAGNHTFQLTSTGTYRITVVYTIYGSGGSPDTITCVLNKKY